MSAAKKNTPSRRAQLARIHILANECGLARDPYEDVLWAVARVRSAADLDFAGRCAVLDHLNDLARRRKGSSARPRNFHQADRHRLYTKIEALLSDASRPWAYVQTLARRIAKRDALEFCSAHDLHKIVAALEYDRKRRERRRADQ